MRLQAFNEISNATSRARQKLVLCFALVFQLGLYTPLSFAQTSNSTRTDAACNVQLAQVQIETTASGKLANSRNAMKAILDNIYKNIAELKVLPAFLSREGVQ
jgi:hypothetical protein